MSFGSRGESRPAAEMRQADEMMSMLDKEAIEDFVLESDRLRGWRIGSILFYVPGIFVCFGVLDFGEMSCSVASLEPDAWW